MSFYAEALPPSPACWQIDEYRLVRLFAPVTPTVRRLRQRYRAELVAELDALEADAEVWLERRRRLLDAAAALHEELWPRMAHCHGRRPPSPHHPPLPPVAPAAAELAGWSLRTFCLALLRRFGEMTLSELHTMIHRHGYCVAAPHPVKTLADAMGYEVRKGRAERVRRATYRACRSRRPRSRDPLLDRLPDPLFQQAPDLWWEPIEDGDHRLEQSALDDGDDDGDGGVRRDLLDAPGTVRAASEDVPERGAQVLLDRLGPAAAAHLAAIRARQRSLGRAIVVSAPDEAAPGPSRPGSGPAP